MSDASFRHWRLEEDTDGIVRVVMDRAGERTNALGAEVLREFAGVVEQLAARRPRGAILESAKASGFCVGADVREFAPLTDVATATALMREVHALLDRLEQLPFPTCAKIHGTCLGGGLEIALACRHRVALDAPATRIGLPEILLGLHPGFGGTVRSIARCGVFAAMDLMLTGRSLDARRAAAIGLVDRAVPARHLERAARAFVREPRPQRRPPLVARLAASAPLRPLVAGALTARVRRQAQPAHYPAPFALVELWRRHGGDPARMLAAEAASNAALLASDTSRELQRLFFLQERLKGLGRGEGVAPVRRVHVIGAGTMGGDIAAWCALRGLEVTVQDRTAELCADAVRRAAVLFHKRLRDPYARQAAQDRLVVDAAGAGLARADVVIEAVVEDAEIKRAVFAEVERRAPETALLATNTSSIPLETIAAGLARPERLVGLHFFNPVARMQLVEVVATPASPPGETARAAAFAVQIGRLPLPVASAPGFLVNRVLSPYLQEAILLTEEGASAAEVDAVAVAFGMPMGPLELADTVGLDVCLAVGRVLAATLGGTVPESLERLVASGRLGRKSGEGFYAYPRGRRRRRRVERPRFARQVIEDRLLLRLQNEAVACLRERVVADADLVDAGLVFGTGFAPFRGGPLRCAGRVGTERIVARLEGLAATLGPRFGPDPGWAELA